MDIKMLFTRVLILMWICEQIWCTRANTVRSIVPESSELHAVKKPLINAIADGSTLAVEECQKQFQWERWNCPTKHFSKKQTRPLTREQAYVSAITAAGIAHAVSTACYKGELLFCGCKTDVLSPGVKPGCSEDSTFGETVALKFLRALEGSNQDVHTTGYMHNARVGLTVFKENFRTECKCHGVSGSCATKTCWQRASSFDRIAKHLKQKYHKALRVDWNSPFLSSSELPSSQLVFFSDSPNFCRANSTTGWPGTGGRVCSRRRGTNVDKAERRSCRELCRVCGHQVRQRPFVRSWRCNCTFQWCCEVSCQTCTENSVEHYCDAKPLTY